MLVNCYGMVAKMADESAITNSNCRPKRLATIHRFQSNQAHAKQEVRKKLRKVSGILKKKEAERTEEEIHTLRQLPDIVKAAEKNAKRTLQQKERVLEIEDDPDVLDQKCQELARMLQSAKNAVLYTGAGISTAASIPDYRGPNGVWTLLRKGQALSAQDLADAEPTYTHMCITKLYKVGMVKYLVSQNCDGLHIRSGFPRSSMSEVHGNMFIEICKNCKPQKEYLRLFDVTERTAKWRHKTGRTCKKCGSGLVDSIVHFGEKGGLKSPYKWKQAVKAVSKSDLIICLGSSLKVLRRYPCLWRMDIRPEQRPKLVIVNLQWTPKDEQSSLKIHGRCDDVLRRLAEHLGLTVPAYRREVDPLFRLHTPVRKGEEHIVSKKSLKIPAHTGVRQRKVFHQVPKDVSPQTPLHKADFLQESGTTLHPQAFKSISNVVDHVIPLEGVFLKPEPRFVRDLEAEHALHSETLSENNFITHAERDCAEKFFPLLVTASASGALPSLAVTCENRHIPDPLRVKLEQMLKERGVMSSTLDTSSTSKIPLTENRSVLSATAPLPGIGNFLHKEGGGEGVTLQHHTHPSLCQLLNPVPAQSQVKKDQEVFRVDLSTSPISISTTHCSPASQCLGVTLEDTAHPASASVEPKTRDTPWASASGYAKLLRIIRFDHSYSKPAHKAHPSGKMQNDIRDSLSCSVNTQMFPHLQNSPSLPASSVIPISSYNHLTMNQNTSEQGVEWYFLQQYGSSNSNPVHLGHCLSHVLSPDGSEAQDKVVVNLNAGTAMAFPTLAQSRVLSMQQPQDMKAAGSAQPSVSFSDGHCALPRRVENGDEDSENHQTSERRKKPGSIPGWFGKGLRIRRKRTT